MYPQQTGWQQQPQQPLYGQQTGFQQPQPQQQGGFARPPLPPQASGQYSFLSAPPPSSSGLSPQQTGWQQQQQQPLRQQATGWAGAGIVPQATGWQGAGQQQPLMPQATGWHDPRLQMMQSSFMPMNTAAPFAQSGMPVFQQPSLPAGNLQSSMNLLNQTPSVKTPKIPWALTKDERKNYDQIFRAWDKDGSGFISGEMAREVFGQSGLGQDDMAQIWTLADMDNRGKLNIQEFHVAMALIYRRLNGNDMPAVLPAELVPASSKDLDSNVDFLKSLLRNDTNSRSTSTDPSYAKTRSFNDASPAGGDRKKDGTVYKHDEDRELGKTYKSSSRHLDRSSVRTGKESASDDLAQIKRDLANTSSRLDDRLEERGRRDEEDELLDEEMDDLKRRVRRIKDDIEYVSSGRPTSQKDEERRKLERELLHIAHEKIPDVERRIEERDERKKREEREGVRARDRRNDRYGGRYEDEDRDRGYRGSYDRDDRDYRDRDRNRDRSRDRYDSYSSSSRDRPRSPPPAPAPPAHSLAAPAAPPAPPKPTASPAPAGQTREQRLAEARARALQKLEDRKRALGLGSAEPEIPTVDSSVSERIEREKREAEEAGKRAEEERAKKEADRKARLEAEKGGPAKSAAAPIPAPPAPPAGGAPAVAPKAAPPPPKPRSILKSRAPAPPPSKAEASSPPTAADEAKQEEEDPVERQLREREERLKKSAADRAARMAALEAQEEEERKAEEAFNARRQQAKSSATSTPSAPKSPEPTPELAVPAAAVAQASTTSTGGTLGAHNPFAKYSAAGGAGPSAAPSSAAPDAAKFFKPPTPSFTPPPMAAPLAKAPTKKFVPTPADDEDWDVIEDKGNESDSSDDYDTAKRRKAELAKALFGGIMPSSSPAPSSNPPSSAPTPALAASASPTDSAPPKNPMLAALGGGSAEPAARGGLFAAIQGGAKLKKAVTIDKSTPAVTGAVVGDAAPPSHISDVPRAVSPPPSPPADEDRAEPASANANRQSVDWYAGLAANAPSGASAPTSLPAQVEEEEDEDAHANRQGSQAPVGELDGVDMSISLRVRTLFSYDGQRPEDLSFTENVMVEAHPATDPESPWYYGTTIKDRKSGWFPSSYVADVADVVQAKALYSYTGSSDQELPFVEGDVLTIVEHTDESWWKAVSDGIVFLVPAAYLQLQGQSAIE